MVKEIQKNHTCNFKVQNSTHNHSFYLFSILLKISLCCQRMNRIVAFHTSSDSRYFWLSHQVFNRTCFWETRAVYLPHPTPVTCFNSLMLHICKRTFPGATQSLMRTTSITISKHRSRAAHHLPVSFDLLTCFMRSFLFMPNTDTVDAQ